MVRFGNLNMCYGERPRAVTAALRALDAVALFGEEERA